MWSEHYHWAIADDMTAESFIHYHQVRGLRIPVVEVLVDWARSDARDIAVASTPVLDAAVRVGASSVVAATLERRPPT